MERVEPKIQSDFPYYFTEDGHLIHRDTKEPYVFTFRLQDVQRTEKNHLALCHYITQSVYNMLEDLYQLHRVYLSHNRQADPQCGFVYMSPGALEHPGTLLILIQDWGTVHCGVWSWRAVAHEGLERGSQIPYVRRALRESCAVLLMNPNQGGLSPEEHVRAVWDVLVARSVAERVGVVTHGYGGLAFVNLLCQRPEEVQRRVWAAAFLDSSHSLWHQPLGPASRDWLKAHSRRWVLSTKPLNRSVSSLRAGCLQMSAGTQSHDMVPAVCMESVFRFFAKLMSPKAMPTPFDIITRSRSQVQGRLGVAVTNNHDNKKA
ncbi:cotranscriptional regulator FAM172A homolog [Chanos chanos]|uniref:Cotranscriptional regulator FAM172A homolog n=1 Tax=Chanos chanos TaxID=29144 RepID=A0AC58UVV5_CHACN